MDFSSHKILSSFHHFYLFYQSMAAVLCFRLLLLLFLFNVLCETQVKKNNLITRNKFSVHFLSRPNTNCRVEIGNSNCCTFRDSLDFPHFSNISKSLQNPRRMSTSSQLVKCTNTRLSRAQRSH